LSIDPQTHAPARNPSSPFVVIGSRAANLRPTTAAAALGAVVGLAIGCAYLGGSVAKATTVRMQAERIEGATLAGFTEEALSAAAGGMDSSALSIARRHDPYTVAGGAQRDRQAELLTARLEQLRATDSGQAGLRRINNPGGPSAQPFQMGGALDQSRDLECLTQAVYYEARGEGRDGMAAVAQVVLNRSRHAAFPRTVCGVVFQGAGRRTGCQFSFTCDGSMRRGVNGAAWSRARGVAEAALSGRVYAPVGTATHFHTTAVSPRWRNSLVQVGQVGSHLFYRFGGRNGGSNAFAYTPRPSGSGEVERPIHASLDPSSAARQAGGAIAYTLVLAQEGLSGGEAERDRAASASVPAAPAEARPAEPRPAAATPAPTPIASANTAPHAPAA
jgi:spore germination cell wall hydrolase CwlJ-like protein